MNHCFNKAEYACKTAQDGSESTQDATNTLLKASKTFQDASKPFPRAKNCFVSIYYIEIFSFEYCTKRNQSFLEDVCHKINFSE